MLLQTTMPKRPKKRTAAELNEIEDLNDSENSTPLIFISHDSRDADLAEAFAMLLTDASGGILKSFRSSDKSGNAGIEFGAEWYRAIMQKLDEATDVVALLTERSLNRPWILYESGVAKGKLDRTVLGLALGVSLETAATGPFAQFQNSGEDEDSITKLVLQLIRRHPDAAPREEAVRRQVQAFKQQIEKLLSSRQNGASKEAHKTEDSSVAKLFEEIKVQIRDLPELTKFVRQLHSELLPAINTIVQKNQPPRKFIPNRPQKLFDVSIGDKNIAVVFANTWMSQLVKLGWPDDPKAEEFLNEIKNSILQNKSKIDARCKVPTTHGIGYSQPNLMGVGLILNNFTPFKEGVA